MYERDFRSAWDPAMAELLGWSDPDFLWDLTPVELQAGEEYVRRRLETRA